MYFKVQICLFLIYLGILIQIWLYQATDNSLLLKSCIKTSRFKFQLQFQFVIKIFLMRSLTTALRRTSTLATKTASILNFTVVSTVKPIKFSLNYSFSQNKSQTQNILKSSYNGDGFHVEQMLVGCLAIYSYYVQSNGEAWIIDPQNDISKYNELLKEKNTKLKGVFLTHYHADYIAGHTELQKVHNCQVYLGPKALEQKGITVLKDGQKIKLGNVQLQCMHTPGHTQQSSCLLLHNKSGKQQILFTGDTVFLNEVGRPDLAVKTNLTAKDLAQLLFQSVQKVKKIDDNVRIYPGHGSGSACGKSIGTGDFCDMGTQKKNNYALKQGDKSRFVEQVLKQMPTPPAYFSYNARLNKFDEFDYQDAFRKANTKFSLDQFKKLKSQGLRIIDIRSMKQLNSGIIHGALCFHFNGGFATWVGTLVSPKQEIVLFGQEKTVVQAIQRLLRIGYTNIRGYGNFKIEQWRAKGLQMYNPEWSDSVFLQGRTVLDVRKPAEWKTGVADAPQVVTCQLSDLFVNYEKIDKSKKYVVHCRSGYRARIAYSMLKGVGFDVIAAPIEVEKIGKLKKLQ